MLFVRVISGSALCSWTGSSFSTARLTDRYLEYLAGDVAVEDAGPFSSDIFAIV
jgi:hypothetical protein